MGSIIVVPRHQIDERVIDAWSELMRATAKVKGQSPDHYSPWRSHDSTATLIARDTKYRHAPMIFADVEGEQLANSSRIDTNYPIRCLNRMVADLKRYAGNGEAQREIGVEPLRIRYLDEDPLPGEQLTIETSPRNGDGQTRLLFG
jgi:hypothetical protein